MSKDTTRFLSFKETLMNEFGHAPKLVSSREFRLKSKGLGYNNQIGSKELLQTVCPYEFIDFRKTREVGLNLEKMCLSCSGFGIGTMNAFFQQSGNIWRLSIVLMRIVKVKLKFIGSCISILAEMQSRPLVLFKIPNISNNFSGSFKISVYMINL